MSGGIWVPVMSGRGELALRELSGKCYIESILYGSLMVFGGKKGMCKVWHTRGVIVEIYVNEARHGQRPPSCHKS